TRFAAIQLLAQGLGVLSGFLIVRSLVTTEYAYYTIAATIVGSMAVLADTGVSSALSAIGGQVHDDPARFGSLIRTAPGRRRSFAMVAPVSLAPILAWLLSANGASAGLIAVLIIGVLANVWLQLSLDVLAAVPRLALQTERIQLLDAVGASARLALIAAA